MNLISYTKEYSIKSRRQVRLQKEINTITNKISLNKKILSHTNEHHAKNGKANGELIGKCVGGLAGMAGLVALTGGIKPITIGNVRLLASTTGQLYAMAGFIPGSMIGGKIGGKIGYIVGHNKNKRTTRKQKYLYKKLNRLNNKLYKK